MNPSNLPLLGIGNPNTIPNPPGPFQRIKKGVVVVWTIVSTAKAYGQLEEELKAMRARGATLQEQLKFVGQFLLSRGGRPPFPELDTLNVPVELGDDGGEGIMIPVWVKDP